MINYYDLPEESLPMSMRILREVLQERGWKAEKFCAEGLNNLVLTRPDGKQLRVASSAPPTTNAFAMRLADDKLATYAALQTIGIPQPETVAVREPEDALPLLQKYGRIVIKPVDASHGHGITMNITDEEQLRNAVEAAITQSTELGYALAQPQLAMKGPELRVICIDYHFIVAIARIPATVMGDGEHTVEELIDLENRTLRAKPYTSNLAYIDRENALAYLGEKAAYVPAQGEKVQVSAICNVGQGGTVEDHSDRITPEQKAQAELIARTMELPVIGIDYFGDQVIEVNACPSLHYPFSEPEKARRCIEEYVNYLERL